ncbi:MAG: ABC transporter substrate-binding protein [Gemmatimonadales bacterium]
MKRLLVLSFALGVAACSDNSNGPDNSANQLVVGALLSLTGPGQTLGQTSQAALQLAADDINAQLTSQNSAIRVSLRVEDTGLDPATALDRLTTLAGQGVRIFIGPQSSSEVAALKPFADSAGVFILSQGSTAGSLSIPDDNIFRFVPDDSQEGKAQVALFASDGIQTVVPLWRQDAGNQGLHDAIAQQFPAQGGTVTAGTSFPPGTTDFSTELDAIRTQVSDAVAQVGPNAVAVYLASFEGAAEIFAQASGDPTLSQVRWYGGDGTVQSAAVIADPTAAGFAAATSFRAPTYGLGDQLLRQDAPLIAAIAARTGITPDAFPLAAYDALHVAALAYAKVGLSSVTGFRTELLSEAAAYSGATGNTTLNANGDRAVGDFEFYQVCAGAPAVWTRVQAYQAASGTIQSVGGC